jgi:hypothetical protein
MRTRKSGMLSVLTFVYLNDKCCCATSYRLCPLCRVESYLVCPSSRAVVGPEKDALIAMYKCNIAKKKCKVSVVRLTGILFYYPAYLV